MTRRPPRAPRSSSEGTVPGPGRRSTARAVRGQLAAWAFLAPVTAYLLLCYVYPLYRNLDLSLRNYTVRSFVQGGAPFSGLANYRAVLRDPTFGAALTNTLLFTGVSLLFQFALGLALADEAAHPVEILLLHALGGLVEQGERRRVGDRAAEREQLLLATAQGAGALLQPFGEAREGYKQLLVRRERAVGAMQGQVLADAERIEHEPLLRCVGHPQALAGMGGHGAERLPAQAHRAGDRGEVAHQETQQRGLADAVASQDAQHLAARDRTADPAQHDGVAVAAGEPVESEERGRGRAGHFRPPA